MIDKKIIKVPPKLANLAMGATTLREVEDACRAEVYRALDELSRADLSRPVEETTDE